MNQQEITPAIGTTIVKRKFALEIIDGEEKRVEITDREVGATQIVKGYTGNRPEDPHEPYAPSPHMTRCEPTPDGLTAPAIVCESGEIIPLDIFFFSWSAVQA